MYDTPRKYGLSHHYFLTSITRAWINPGLYSSEEFEVQTEIIALRIKIKLFCRHLD